MPPKRDREIINKGDRGEITGYLAAGTFNCAHVNRRDGVEEVLRVALLIDDTDDHKAGNRMVKRGLDVVSAMQNHRDMLGPSLVRETLAWKEFNPDEMEEYFNMHSLCPSMLQKIERARQFRAKYTFATQHLEYLTGKSGEEVVGRGTTAPQELTFYVFSLVWFFYTARENFGLYHRDFKLGNLVFRKTAAPAVYDFTLTLGAAPVTYRFQSQYVPVVIDYDFATVDATEDWRQRYETLGTYEYMPPEVLVGTLANLDTDMDTVDWWSLGVVVVELALDMKMYQVARREVIAYAKAVIAQENSGLNKGQKRFITALATHVIICAALQVMPIGIILNAIWDRYKDELQDLRRVLFYSPVAFDHLELIRNSDSYRQFEARVNEYRAEQPVRREVIDFATHKLLSLSPNNRKIDMFAPQPLFARFIRPNNAAAAAAADHSYEYGPSVMPSDKVNVIDYPMLARPIACAATATCNNRATHMCPCCAAAYCGERCRREQHH